MAHSAASEIVLSAPRATRRQARSRFYVGASVLLLAIAFTGFAKSFYLKAFFETPALPFHVHLHGIVMTGWFVMLVAQTLLAQSGRSELHRRLGIAGTVWAAGVVSVTLFATVRAVPRLEAAGLDAAFLTVGALAGTLFFGAWVGAAVWARRRPQVHRPLMLFATLQLATAAISRIPILADEPLTKILIVQGAFVAALGVRDVIERGRLRKVTWVGGSALLLSSPLITWLPTTPLGPAVVRWLT